MTTLEERVARALWLDVYPDLPWESHRRNEQIKDDYRGHARAAIAAVREHEASAAEAMRVRCEAIAREGTFPFELDVWLNSTKKDMTARVAIAIADAIAALANSSDKARGEP